MATILSMPVGKGLRASARPRLSWHDSAHAREADENVQWRHIQTPQGLMRETPRRTCRNSAVELRRIV